MIKVLEVTRTISDSDFVSNIYTINKLARNIIEATEYKEFYRSEDFEYINILAEKTKVALQKITAVMKL